MRAGFRAQRFGASRMPGNRDEMWLFIHDYWPEPMLVYVPPIAAGTKYDWQFTQSAGAI